MELESIFKEVKGLDNMRNEACKFCGKEKKILVSGKNIKMYKFCDCEQSQEAIRLHDNNIKDKRVMSKRFEFNDYNEKAKFIQKMDKGNPVDVEIWTDNVNQLFFEFIGYEKDLYNKIKDVYIVKYNDKKDYLKPDEYYRRLTEIFFNVYS